MPWKIEERNDKYCVIREGGKVEKCHITKKAALAHMRALYTNVHERSKGMLNKLIDAIRGVFRAEEIAEGMAEGIAEKTEGGVGSPTPFWCKQQPDGTFRWFAIWSNKYRDQDLPPEILKESAHIDFAEAVNKSQWEYPELWLYHVPGTKWGQSDLIAYDVKSGFSIASGTVDKGMEPIAEALNSAPVPVKVSHGMPREEIQRDPDDRTILTRFRTKEISPLPAAVAANELTGFALLEGSMELTPKEAEERLKTLLGEEKYTEVSSLLGQMGTGTKEANLEFKEVEDSETDEEPSKESKEETTEPENAEKSEDGEEAPPPITREEVVDAIKFSVKEATSQITDQFAPMFSALQEHIDTISATLTDLQASDEEKIAKVAAETPRYSIKDMVSNVIGKEQAKTSGRESLVKSGPKETSPNAHGTIPQTIVRNIVKGKEGE